MPVSTRTAHARLRSSAYAARPVLDRKCHRTIRRPPTGKAMACASRPVVRARRPMRTPSHGRPRLGHLPSPEARPRRRLICPDKGAMRSRDASSLHAKTRDVQKTTRARRRFVTSSALSPRRPRAPLPNHLAGRGRGSNPVAGRRRDRLTPSEGSRRRQAPPRCSGRIRDESEVRPRHRLPRAIASRTRAQQPP